MKPLVVSALALSVLSAAARAEEPVILTDTQMDVVTAATSTATHMVKVTAVRSAQATNRRSTHASVELTGSTKVTDQGIVVVVDGHSYFYSDLPPGGSASFRYQVTASAAGQTVRVVESE